MILRNHIAGAKYGGYGSFLPIHQRSPVWPHPKAPQKYHSQDPPRSPSNLHLEVHFLYENETSVSVIHFLKLN